MRIEIVAGTRPEIIKLAPVRAALLGRAEVRWTATGQHGALADDAMAGFAITPDARLHPDWDRRSLTGLAAALIGDLGRRFAASAPDYVLVQGDTATAWAGAQAAFLSRIPFGHVEAGLRSFDLASPFPEEGFRRLIAPIAAQHFAPTRRAQSNLLAEGVPAERIHVTGNTVVDTLLSIAQTAPAPAVLDALQPGERLVLVTMHRRENWDARAADICAAIKRLRDRFPDVRFLVSTHSNPRVREPVTAALSGEDRIVLSEPLAYPDFIAALRRSYLVLSDSGGVQEEAPSFGVPVLVLRDETERPEAVEAGVARLVGASPGRIVAEATRLLGDAEAHASMARRGNPFGDGRAGERIAGIVLGDALAEQVA